MPHLEANRPAPREQQQVCRGTPLQCQLGGRRRACWWKVSSLRLGGARGWATRRHHRGCPPPGRPRLALQGVLRRALTPQGSLRKASEKWAGEKASLAHFDPSGKPTITVLYEDELVPFLLSSKARARVEAAAAMPATAQRGAYAPREATAPPLHAPDLRAIRFTSLAQRAHGCGEPGGKGALLADALAAPDGFTLGAALVAARSVNEMFAWTMLQTASVADGAPADLAPEILVVQWGADAVHRAQGGSAAPVPAPAPAASATAGGSAAEEEGAAGAAAEGGAVPGAMGEEAAAEGLAVEGAAAEGRTSGAMAGKRVGQAEGSWLGQGSLEEGEVRGARELPRGANPRLDRLCELRRKPCIRRAHSLTADTTVSHGHGQMHSKFWLLHFVSTQARALPPTTLPCTHRFAPTTPLRALSLDPASARAVIASLLREAFGARASSPPTLKPTLKPTTHPQADRRDARLRLVVTSGNALPGAFGGMPDARQLCGLWWADFVIASDAAAAAASDDDDDNDDDVTGAAPPSPPPPPSAFRAALLHHVEACTYHAHSVRMPCT